MEDVLKPHSSFLPTVSSRLFWCNSYLMLFGVGVSCRILFSIVIYLYVFCSESITSVEEERAYLSAIVYLYVIMWFLFGEVSSSSWRLGWALLF